MNIQLYNAPQARVRVLVYDLNGRVIHRQENVLSRSYETIRINLTGVSIPTSNLLIKVVDKKDQVIHSQLVIKL